VDAAVSAFDTPVDMPTASGSGRVTLGADAAVMFVDKQGEMKGA